MKGFLKYSDSLTSAGALVALSCLPFYTLGQLGVEIPLWIAYVLGGLGLTLFVVRLGMIIFGAKPILAQPRVQQGLNLIIGFALPLGVMEGIMEYANHTSSIDNYIFSGIILLIGILIMFVPVPND
ncbi:MAG: hypothetical protein K2M07_04990 [Muribaculaceae bacterium]|nr:hypothetical protein [Muribaculaceae bacterium]